MYGRGKSSHGESEGPREVGVSQDGLLDKMVVSPDMWKLIGMLVAGLGAWFHLRSRVRVLEHRFDDREEDIRELRGDVDEMRDKHLEVITAVAETNQRLAVLAQKFEDL